jgi:hypothetical protein
MKDGVYGRLKIGCLSRPYSAFHFSTTTNPDATWPSLVALIGTLNDPGIMLEHVSWEERDDGRVNMNDTRTAW